MISPQFGQRNFVASAPGGIVFPQLVHVTNVIVAAFSVITYSSMVVSLIIKLPYNLYASKS
jgi:hypothetical protein